LFYTGGVKKYSNAYEFFFVITNHFSCKVTSETAAICIDKRHVKTQLRMDRIKSSISKIGKTIPNTQSKFVPWLRIRLGHLYRGFFKLEVYSYCIGPREVCNLRSIFGSFRTLEKEVDQTYDFLPDMSDLDSY